MPIIAERKIEDISTHYPPTYRLFSKPELTRAWNTKPDYIKTLVKSEKCLTIQGIDIADAYVVAAIFMREIVERVEMTWYDRDNMTLYLCYIALTSKWDNHIGDAAAIKAKEVVKRIISRPSIYNIVDDFQGYPLLAPTTRRNIGRSGAT